MHYMPATSQSRALTDQCGAALHMRPLMLLRGEDRCGKNDGPRIVIK
ncbi:MAG: hypothetical protein P8N43_12690 [Alphaproteobacteria bacterium]|nr:hypothetical protein [Alphaproteobacteria bacterium]